MAETDRDRTRFPRQISMSILPSASITTSYSPRARPGPSAGPVQQTPRIACRHPLRSLYWLARKDLWAWGRVRPAQARCPPLVPSTLPKYEAVHYDRFGCFGRSPRHSASCWQMRRFHPRFCRGPHDQESSRAVFPIRSRHGPCCVADGGRSPGLPRVPGRPGSDGVVGGRVLTDELSGGRALLRRLGDAFLCQRVCCLRFVRPDDDRFAARPRQQRTKQLRSRGLARCLAGLRSRWIRAIGVSRPFNFVLILQQWPRRLLEPVDPAGARFR
jgi:hypothetical protein